MCRKELTDEEKSLPHSFIRPGCFGSSYRLRRRLGAPASSTAGLRSATLLSCVSPDGSEPDAKLETLPMECMIISGRGADSRKPNGKRGSSFGRYLANSRLCECENSDSAGLKGASPCYRRTKSVGGKEERRCAWLGTLTLILKKSIGISIMLMKSNWWKAGTCARSCA